MNDKSKFTKLASDMPLDQWHGDLTLFKSFTDVLPLDKLVRASWKDLCNYIAQTPSVGEEKKQLPFFVPCRLKDAAMTLHGQRLTGTKFGKQRSNAHMTQAHWLVIDCDGLDKPVFAATLKSVNDFRLAILAFSTHSNGREDKPGVRARVCVPVDVPLGAVDYKCAALGLDMLLTGGAAVAADASVGRLGQQQGVWATTPDRVEHAFSLRIEGRVWSASELIKLTPTKASKQSSGVSLHPTSPPNVQVQRIRNAMPWLRDAAEHYEPWSRVISALKAAAIAIGYNHAKILALEFSALASDKAQADNDKRQYSPAHFFDNVQPVMPPEAGVGVVLGIAKEAAIAVVTAESGGQALSVRAQQALIYLNCNHRAWYDKNIFAEVA